MQITARRRQQTVAYLLGLNQRSDLTASLDRYAAVG